jgi:hypothetical protein
MISMVNVARNASFLKMQVPALTENALDFFELFVKTCKLVTGDAVFHFLFVVMLVKGEAVESIINHQVISSLVSLMTEPTNAEVSNHL